MLKWLRENDCMSWDEVTIVVAARCGHLEVLKWACENGCPMDEDICALAPGPGGRTSLYNAAGDGRFAVVRVLIEAGADINRTTDEGATPLYVAAQSGQEVVMRALIKAGADVNKATDDGGTPLFIAARNGHDAIVRALIEAGADVNKAMLTCYTPLHIATGTLGKGHARLLRCSEMPAR